MAEQRVVVEIHLGVEGDHGALLGDDQRVDLGERGVELGEGLVEREHEAHRILDLVALEAEAEGEAARMERLHAGGRIDRHHEDLLGGLGGDLLDLHAALGRRHHGDAPGGAVDQHAEIELAADVEAFLDVDALDFLALGAGLVGDQVHADHLLGGIGHVLDGLDHLDAAALAAAAGMDLGLHDPDAAAQLLGDFFGFLRGVGDAAFGHGDAKFGEQAFGLIFVNVHRAQLLLKEGRPRAQKIRG